MKVLSLSSLPSQVIYSCCLQHHLREVTAWQLSSPIVFLFSIVNISYLIAIPVRSLDSFSGIGTTWSSVLYPSIYAMRFSYT